jgi:hypothetical protein
MRGDDFRGVYRNGGERRRRGVSYSGLFFLGRPLPGTLRIASRAEASYMTSLLIGLIPALCNRLRTLSGVMLSIAAISEIVIPVIAPIIGMLNDFLINVCYFGLILYKCLVVLKKKVKKMSDFSDNMLDKLSEI